MIQFMMTSFYFYHKATQTTLPFSRKLKLKTSIRDGQAGRLKRFQCWSWSSSLHTMVGDDDGLHYHALYCSGQMMARHRENDQTLQTKTITDVIIMTLPYTHMVLKSNTCFTKLENRIILALITCKVWMFWKPVTELHWTFIVPLLALLALELEQGSYITHIKDFFHHLNCRSYHHKLILYENTI